MISIGAKIQTQKSQFQHRSAMGLTISTPKEYFLLFFYCGFVLFSGIWNIFYCGFVLFSGIFYCKSVFSVLLRICEMLWVCVVFSVLLRVYEMLWVCVVFWDFLLQVCVFKGGNSSLKDSSST